VPSCLPPLLGYDFGLCQDLDDKLALARGAGGDVAVAGSEPFRKFLAPARDERIRTEGIAEGQPVAPQAASWLGAGRDG